MPKPYGFEYFLYFPPLYSIYMRYSCVDVDFTGDFTTQTDVGSFVIMFKCNTNSSRWYRKQKKIFFRMWSKKREEKNYSKCILIVSCTISSREREMKMFYNSPILAEIISLIKLDGHENGTRKEDADDDGKKWKHKRWRRFFVPLYTHQNEEFWIWEIIVTWITFLESLSIQQLKLEYQNKLRFFPLLDIFS